jgi:hypothetical protein
MSRTWLCLSAAAALIGLVACAHAQRSMSGMGITLTGRSGGGAAAPSTPCGAVGLDFTTACGTIQYMVVLR